MIRSHLSVLGPSGDTARESVPGIARVLGIAGGTVFTLVLFLGIARFKPGSDQTIPAADDLLVVMLPEPPPPPPRTAPDVPETTTEFATGFDLSPSDSAVKIAASPSAVMPPPEALSLPPPPTVSISAPPRAALSLALNNDPHRIFQRGEVDQGPLVLERSNMNVPRAIRGAVDSLSFTFLCVINNDGTVGNVTLARSSGNPRVDALITEKMREWKFSPAIKGGRKVRCLVEQAVTIQWSTGGSPFE